MRLPTLRGSSHIDYAPEDGLALIWLIPWDGNESLRQDTLDEWYIEICRRVRLVNISGRIAAQAGNSKVPRIVPREGGVMGDPWSPTVLEKGGGRKALTVDSRGFHYRRMVELIFDRKSIEPAPLQEIAPTDSPKGLQLLARALVRGQGKTEGYHERRVPLSRKVRDGLRHKSTDPIAAAAAQRVHLAGEIQGHVFKPALLVLFQNAPEKLNFKDKDSNAKSEHFLRRLDAEIDADFFEALWDEIDKDGDEAQHEERAKWVHSLLMLAFNLLQEAETATAIASRRRFRSEVRARATFWGAAHRNAQISPYLPELATHDEQQPV